MQKLSNLILIFLISSSTLFGQILHTDTNDFIFYNGTSQVICSNSGLDSLQVDLDSDSIPDLKISFNNYWSRCWYGISYNNFMNVQLEVTPYGNTNVLCYGGSSSWFFGAYAMHIKTGDSINLNSSNLYLNQNNKSTFFHEHDVNTLYGCMTLKNGFWHSLDKGNFIVTKPNGLNTDYYLIGLKRNQNYTCFQLTSPLDTSSLINITTSTTYLERPNSIHPYYAEGKLFIDLMDSDLPLTAEIYNLTGNKIKTQILQRENTIDFSNEYRGLYFVRFIDESDQLLKSYKFIKP